MQYSKSKQIELIDGDDNKKIYMAPRNGSSINTQLNYILFVNLIN
jgi:hypothetical protein